MVKIKCECLYCGYDWVKEVWSPDINGLECEKCGDKNIKAKEFRDKEDIYGYMYDSGVVKKKS